MRKSLAFLTLIFSFFAAAHVQAAVLLYDSDTRNHNAVAALDNLGMSYTVANYLNFNTLLEGSSWDLVVIDMPSTYFSPSASLATYVNSGGKVILSTWTDLSFASLFDVEIISAKEPSAIYSWGHSDTVWAGITQIDPNSDYYDSNGFYLNALSGATALGGYTEAFAGGQAAIVLGNSGRTIFNAWLFDNFSNPGGITMIENQIKFLSDREPVASPEPGSALLLGAGLLLTGFMARRRD